MNFQRRFAYEKDFYHFLTASVISMLAGCGESNPKNASSQSKPSEGKNVIYTSGGAPPNLKIEITNTDNTENSIKSLSVFTNDNEKLQNIIPAENTSFTKQPIYFRDINFDGHEDLLIPYQRTAAAEYFIGYIWNESNKQFTLAPTFQSLANVCLDAEKKVLLSNRSADKTTFYSISSYNNQTKDFITQKTFSYYSNGAETTYTEEALIDGSLQKTSEFTLPSNNNYYAASPELSKYLSDESVWNLNGGEWKNYLIPPSEITDK